MTEDGEKRTEVCTLCGLRWNVSKTQKEPRGGYICPWCDSKKQRQTKRKKEAEP